MKIVETPEEFESWCDTHGYSKDDLAEVLGVTRQTIYNWTHRRPSQVHGSLPDEVKNDLLVREKAYRKIPRMLTFALLAIETMAPVNVFGGRRLRKRSKSL